MDDSPCCYEDITVTICNTSTRPVSSRTFERLDAARCQQRAGTVKGSAAVRGLPQRYDICDCCRTRVTLMAGGCATSCRGPLNVGTTEALSWREPCLTPRVGEF